MSGGLYPDTHLDLSSLQIAIETLSLSIAMIQSPFPVSPVSVSKNATC
jgi:hypothetical protein